MPTIKCNGINLAYESNGAGHPLVLIGGLAYGAWQWQWLVPELSPYYQVITFDNRGADGSDKPEGPYTTPMMAADTIGLLDGLGLQRAHVMGISLGGFIVQHVAIERPDLVDKLILAATNYGGPNAIPPRPEVLKVMMDRSGDPIELLKRGFALATASGYIDRHPEMGEELLRYRLTNPVPPPQYQAQVMAGAGHNTEARVGEIKAPTLILFGAEDNVVNPENAELLRQKIPNSQVTILPGVGHMSVIEDPKRVAQTIREFLG
ncbi:MAG: alpha/beta hydrolase [Anaerolineae bacterium]